MKVDTKDLSDVLEKIGRMANAYFAEKAIYLSTVLVNRKTYSKIAAANISSVLNLDNPVGADEMLEILGLRIKVLVDDEMLVY